MKPHRTDMLSLIFALIFLALAGWWFATRLLGFSLPSMAWLAAGALILVGLLGMVGALTAPRRRGPGADEPVTGPPDGFGGTGPR